MAAKMEHDVLGDALRAAAKASAQRRSKDEGVSKLDADLHAGRVAQVTVQAGELPEAVDATFDVLRQHATDLELYVNAGALVRPYLAERNGFEGADGQSEVVQSLELARISQANLRVDIMRRVAFVTMRPKKDGTFRRVLIDCPKSIAQSLFESSERLQQLPQIERLSEVPVFDGESLHSEPGLFGGTWVHAPAGVQLPAKLTQKTAAAALQRVNDYLTEFPFEESQSRAVALAMLMTAALRPSLSSAPGLVISKPCYGAGATMLARLAGMVLTGRNPPVMPFDRREEATKQLNATLIAGTQILIPDNLPEGMPFSHSLLAQLLSEPLIEVRELGTSRKVLVDSRRLVIATGVNVMPDADLIRRMLVCRLDPRVERAEAREFKRPNLWQEFSRDRPAILSDLFTVTAAYLNQTERVSVRPLAGYDQFRSWVAEPLVWLGQPDVIESAREGAANDTTRGQLAQVLPLLHRLHSSPRHASFAGVTTHDMAMQKEGGGNDWYRLRDELHAVLGEATGAKVFNGEIQMSWVSVGRWLLRVSKRVVGDRRLVKAGMKNGQVAWKVETLPSNGGDS